MANALNFHASLDRCLFDVAFHIFVGVVGCCHIESMCGNMFVQAEKTHASARVSIAPLAILA